VRDRIDAADAGELERGLRERLAAIGAQVPVGEPPERTHHGRPGTPRVMLALMAAGVAAVVVSAIALRSRDSAQVDIADTPRTTAPQLVATPCRDDRAGPVFASGADGEGSWEYTVTGQPPAVSQAIRFRGPTGEGAGSATHTAASWAALVERGELGTWAAQRDPLSPVAFVAGELPSQARAVRLRYPDGRVEEICTVGRLIRLPVVYFVAELARDNPPETITAVDADGQVLATGNVTVRDQTDPETGDPIHRSLDVQMELDRGLAPLPLQPAP
jgi:hypothetical protein